MPYNLATLAGSLLGSLLPNTSAWGLDVVFPLLFLALLVPLVTSRRHVVVALVAEGSALALTSVAPGGAVVLVAAVGAKGGPLWATLAVGLAVCWVVRLV